MSSNGTPVYVNIYDMYTMNNYTSLMGIGVYHTGVEIHGVEYSYGGHPYPFSGIFEMVPKDVEELGETFKFKQSLEIGRTDFTAHEIEQLVTTLGMDYRGIDYHLINKNCNHFTEKICQMLCGAEIPPWINRLAYLTTFVPFVERMVPKEWISPIGIQHTVETHMHQQDANTNNNSTTVERQSGTINFDHINKSLDCIEKNLDRLESSKIGFRG